MDKKLEILEQFTLTPGAFDRYSNITPYAVFDIFQEIASRHAIELNADFNKTNSNNIWLLLRSKYEIIENITKPIKLVVKSWPLEPKRIDYDRDYLVFDQNNNLLIKGTSKWCIYDLESNQISRTIFKFLGIYIKDSNFKEPLIKIELLNLSKDDLVYTQKVTPAFLDINNHMNNAKYSFLLLDALDLDKNEIIHVVEFNFIKELKQNDEVSIYKKKINNTYYVYGYLEDTLHFSSKVTIKNI